MKKTHYIILSFVALLALPFSAYALSTLLPVQGGTGTSQIPTYGQVLVGTSAGVYTPTATSSLGISGGGSSSSYPFPLTGNATSTLTQFNGGVTAFASSTIGSGDSTGLTVVGTATTTGKLFVGRSASISSYPLLTVGTSSEIAPADIAFFNSQTGSDAQIFFQNYSAGVGAYMTVKANSHYASYEIDGGNGDGGVSSVWKFGNFGGNAFNIFDGTNSKTPFIVEQNSPTNTLYVAATGNVGIATSTPGSLFSIGGNATGWNFYNNATTTKSGIGGIDIRGGCYSINGTCLSTGSSLSTPVSIANGGTATSTGGVTNGIEYFNGTYLTNGSGFTYNGINVGIGTTSPSESFTTTGGILSTESAPATSTSMTLDLTSKNQFDIQLGTSATTLTLSNLIAGQSIRVVACNPGASASTVTFATSPANKILWTQGFAPVQTTTANKCDLYTFTVTQATSTTATSPTVFGGYVQNF